MPSKQRASTSGASIQGPLCTHQAKASTSGTVTASRKADSVKDVGGKHVGYREDKHVGYRYFEASIRCYGIETLSLQCRILYSESYIAVYFVAMQNAMQNPVQSPTLG